MMVARSSPGRPGALMSIQRLRSGLSFGMLPATSPRWGPKNVLCVLPVTMSAPSSNGSWNAP